MSGIWVGVGLAAAGLVTQVAGQQSAKKAGKAESAFAAAEQRAEAMQVRGIGQRAAAGERKRAALVSSAIQARAGGGGLDPTVVGLEREVAAEGEYRALTALYNSEGDAKALEAAADAGMRTSRARSKAYNLQTAGTVLQGAGTMYGRYSDKPPPKISGSYNMANDFTQANSSGNY